MKRNGYRWGTIVSFMMLITAFNVTSSLAINLVTNGGFETGDFSGWVKSGTYMYVTSNYKYDGKYAADIGTYKTYGTLTQTNILTDPGMAYNLSFYLASSGGANTDFQAVVNGVLLFDLKNAGWQPYTFYDFTFTAGQSPSELVFYERNDPGAFHLDDVSVAPVPEPSTFILIGAGLLGVGFLRKRVRT